MRLMFVHPVWVGELSMEKVHQRVKRALKYMNFHSEHILAVNAIRFQDWQGRLHSCMHISSSSHPYHLRESIRLLAGHAYTPLRNACISQTWQHHVHQIMNDSSPFIREPEVQGHTALSMHRPHCSSKKYVLGKPSYLFDHSTASTRASEVFKAHDLPSSIKCSDSLLETCLCTHSKREIANKNVLSVPKLRDEFNTPISNSIFRYVRTVLP